MRPLLVVLVWVVILGGLTVYMRTRHLFVARQEQPAVIKPLPGEYVVEVTPTFNVHGGADPFGLEVTDKPALSLWLKGREIVRREEPMPAGVAQRFRWDASQTPIETGANEFRLRLHVPQADSQTAHGARLRLLRDGEVVLDQTVWSPPGAPLEDVVHFELAERAGHGRGHGH